MGENISEFKKTLERIEEKLISAGKIYSAIQFQIWLVAMLLYYIVIAPLVTVPWQLTMAYWVSAFAIFSYSSMKIWKRMSNLFRSYGKDIREKPSFGIGIFLSWTSGAVLGWGFIPGVLLKMGVNSAHAIGFLSFISISVFGMFITFLYLAESLEREMIPAFLVPALGILTVLIAAPEDMVYAGFVVGFGFSLTVLAYLYNAFRALG